MPRQIKLTKARTFELDPNKKYIMILPADNITEDDADNINKQFVRWGIECMTILSTDPKAISIIETEAKR